MTNNQQLSSSGFYLEIFVIPACPPEAGLLGHCGLSAILLKKDSRQAGMTDSICLRSAAGYSLGELILV
jgi:hypothetical protein